MDPFDNEYSYRCDSLNRYQVRWLGATGDEGGEGLDADWTREALLRAGLLENAQEP